MCCWFYCKIIIELVKLPENIKGVQAEYVLEYIASNEKLKNEYSYINYLTYTLTFSTDLNRINRSFGQKKARFN